MKIRIARIALLLALAPALAFGATRGRKKSSGEFGGAGLSDEQTTQATELLGAFRGAADEAGRKDAFDKLAAMGAKVAKVVQEADARTQTCEVIEEFAATVL